MPPFGQLLSNDDVAELATYLRRSCRYQASGP
jgi:hypothetical protein